MTDRTTTERWIRSASIDTLADPPVTVLKAKNWLKVDHHDDDALIGDLIKEAFSELERRTGLLLRAGTATLTMNRLPFRRREELALPFTPLTALTSFSYVDSSGDSQTLTPHVNLAHKPGLLVPAAGEEWPDTHADNAAAVTIVYECGAEPAKNNSELTGCIKLMLDLAYHDLTPAEMARLEKRRDAIVHRCKIRDPRLNGVSYV